MNPAILKLAALSNCLANAASIEDLGTRLVTDVAKYLEMDELVLDVNTLDFSRPPLFSWNVDRTWADRYNAEFHRLNPSISALKRLLNSGRHVVRRFEDLCPEPLVETEFYQQYMQPQHHRYSMVAGSALLGGGNIRANVVILVVRYETRTAFTDDEIAIAQLLIPVVTQTVQNLMRSTDLWALSVLRQCYGLTPKLSEVGSLVAQGHSNKEIAEQLKLTVGTVKHYVHQILELTGTSSRADFCRILLA